MLPLSVVHALFTSMFVNNTLSLGHYISRYRQTFSIIGCHNPIMQHPVTQLFHQRKYTIIKTIITEGVFYLSLARALTLLKVRFTLL